ncbi:hypothetical protein [Kitasatospora sp. NBC_01300]|uniref:hypothetical protein n=1 Tax=Kitasatospora sp. NBC_01300 TaxID=2903574 RepID=UPI00352E5674|nr:hypothetical protein OG556_38635 [Kitasatospora sp. NBC_01300]
MLAHPEQTVRRAFARNRHASPEQRGRLVDDHDAFIRAGLAAGPRPRLDRAEPLPDDVLEILLTTRDEHRRDQLLSADEIRQELAFSGQIRTSFHRGRLDHPNPVLRAQAASLWLWLAPGQRDALLADPDPTVSEAARDHSRILDPAAMEAELPEHGCHARNLLLINYAVSHAVAEQCPAERRELWSLARDPHTPGDIVARLAHDPDPDVREQVAARADLDPQLLAELAQDPDSAVRARGLLHPLPRTWPRRAAIDRVYGHTVENVGAVGKMFVEPGTSW